MNPGRFAHVPYLIQPGDTLSGIAQRFLGNGDRYPELALINNIQDPSMILAGTIIMIPVLIGSGMMQHPAMVQALKPARALYPTTHQAARVITQEVIDGYQPTWDRDLDIPAEARAEGAVALAQALGIFDADEAEHELNQLAAKFQR